MGIVTIISDWRINDYYLASVKGKIINYSSNIKIVDLAHEIAPFDSIRTAFILSSCFRDFPLKTVHIIAVNSLFDKDNFLLISEIEGHYFISSNNGIVSLISNKKPERIIKIDSSKFLDNSLFPARDVFAPIAARIAEGVDINEFGEEINDIDIRFLSQPIVQEDVISGSVLYIDTYGNAITNISKQLFDENCKERGFVISFRRDQYKITQLSKSYSFVIEGDELALFNSINYLEISINKGNASKLLGLGINDTVKIQFEKPFQLG